MNANFPENEKRVQPDQPFSRHGKDLSKETENGQTDHGKSDRSMAG